MTELQLRRDMMKNNAVSRIETEYQIPANDKVMQPDFKTVSTDPVESLDAMTSLVQKIRKATHEADYENMSVSENEIFQARITSMTKELSNCALSAMSLENIQDEKELIKRRASMFMMLTCAITAML